MRHTLLCYAKGTGDSWEALCVDLDIAVQGRSLEQVYTSLNEAIGTYLKDVLAEKDEKARFRLLHRRAPLIVRASYAVGALLHNLFRRGDGGGRQALFDLPCPA